MPLRIVTVETKCKCGKTIPVDLTNKTNSGKYVSDRVFEAIIAEFKKMVVDPCTHPGGTDGKDQSPA